MSLEVLCPSFGISGQLGKSPSWMLSVTMGWPPWVSGCSSGALLPLYTGTIVSAITGRVWGRLRLNCAARHAEQLRELQPPRNDNIYLFTSISSKYPNVPRRKINLSCKKSQDLLTVFDSVCVMIDESAWSPIRWKKLQEWPQKMVTTMRKHFILRNIMFR